MDLVKFTNYIKTMYNCDNVYPDSDNNNNNNNNESEGEGESESEGEGEGERRRRRFCPVIVIGGSYPGFLAAMARLR